MLSSTQPGVGNFSDVAPEPLSLIDVLRRRALTQPDRLAYTFLTDGETQEIDLTYAELDQQARAIGARLQSIGATGKTVLLLYPSGLEFIAAFCGCLYAGAIAVPAYPPRLNNSMLRLGAIVEDAEARVALTTAQVLSRIEPLFAQVAKAKPIQWLVTDKIDQQLTEEWLPPSVAGETMALLQYTSGSTATPKGVMVSHANLLHNEALIKYAFEQTEHSVIVGWLPLYHDMGLIGNVLQPLYVGARCVLFSPLAFLHRPLRWPQAISRYRGTTSGGPNFAYDLCTRKISSEQMASLDLSSWSVAFNGSEPVRSQTMDQFARSFADCGFRREAFYPCYGLAETTLLATGGEKSAPPLITNLPASELGPYGTNVELKEVVGCGKALPGHQIVIVNDRTQCGPNEVGEIWLAGASVAQGYWNRPAETAETFQAYLADGAGPFLRTGDLGVFSNDELCVVGRLKDLIIVRGRNYYPHDIELVAQQSHEALRPGAGAAFGVEVNGEEKLVLVQEVDHRRHPDFDKVFANIHQAVAGEQEAHLHTIALIKTGSIPKTTSGKIQRHVCRARFLNRELNIVREWREAASENQQLELDRSAPPRTAEAIQEWLRRQLAARLGVELDRISIEQPIAHYGIDSLLAIELMHKVEDSLGVAVPMHSFLKSPSIVELAAEVLGQLETLPTKTTVLAPFPEISGDQPLSFGQQALWFVHQLAPESAAYNISGAARVLSPVDVDTLRMSFQSLVDRHPSLRTNFGALDGAPLQHVHQQQEVSFQQEDAANWSPTALRRRLADEAQRPFDLQHGPLLRIRFFSNSVEGNVLLIVVHHIVADFWSLAVLLNELGILYTAKVAGTRADLFPLPLDYTDYARWQIAVQTGAEGERLGQYWEKQLAGELPPLNLPTDRPRPSWQTFRGAAETFRFGASLTRSLNALSQANNTTLYMTLLAAFQVLLHNYSGQDDIVVGSPTAGRSRNDLRQLVGYFVNPLVLRANLADDPSFETFLTQVRQTVLEAFEHQDFPFIRLIERLESQRDPSRSPLFQTMFIMIQASQLNQEGLAAFALGAAGARINLGALSLESVALDQPLAQFDLKLTMVEAGDELAASLEYNTDLFDAPTIDRFARSFQALLENIAAQPGQRLSQLAILSSSDEAQVLSEWNNTLRDYGRDQRLHRLIEEQVERTPAAIALVSGDERLSYRELNERANQLAHRLRELGVGPEVAVGILMERCSAMVVSLLAVLKAGGAYVPLDPTYPVERLPFMIEDVDAKVLLTQQQWRNSFATASGLTVVCVDREAPAINRKSRSNPLTVVDPDNAAYIIYTSGSTGQPKAAVNTHGAICNRLLWMQEEYSLTADDRVLQKTPHSFDVSVWEFFWPLMTGARLVMAAPGGHRDSAYLVRVIKEEQITTLHFVPSMLQIFLEEEDGVEDCRSLRRVICSGEALSYELQQLFAGKMSASLHNLYGPTEAAVDVTYWACQPGGEKKIVPIGRPIANTQIYLLNRQLRPVPVGVTGELYIGGDGIARGYLRRPDLSADRFIPNPFSSKPGARLYRTGDLARHLREGEIEFLGRTDAQVKIRGFRIELGEIEAVLGAHPSIKAAAVVATEATGRSQQLVGYVVAEDSETERISTPQLRSYLRERLPDYMVPGLFHFLAEMPLTTNGKVDRRALPSPLLPDQTDERQMIKPRTRVEEMLCNIWSEVLGIAKVGVEANFFELGGDSIRSLQVVSRAQKLGLNVSLQLILKYQTIQELSREISGEEIGALEGCLVAPFALVSEEDRQRLPDDVEDAYPLTMLQAGMLFHSEYHPGAAIYHDIFSFHLRACLDLEALATAVRQLVARHAALRTYFCMTGFSKPLQLVIRDVRLPLQIEDLRHLTPLEQDEAVAKWNEAEKTRYFNWSEAPLCRFQIHRRTEETFQLTFSFHHAILDGWSVAFMLTELLQHYVALLKGKSPAIEPPQVSFRDFVALENQALQSDDARRYWDERLSEGNFTTLPRWPAAGQNGGTFEVGRSELAVSAEVSAGLKDLARLASVPLKSVFLAAHLRAISMLCGQTDIVTGLVSNGRPAAIGGDSALGLFLNVLPLRQKLPGGSWLDLARETCESERELLRFRRYPMAQIQRNLGGQKLFETSFNFIHFHVYQSLRQLEELEIIDGTFFEANNYTLSAQFSLNLITSNIDLALRYNAAELSDQEITTIRNYYVRILTAMASEPQARYESWCVLSAEERQQLLCEWNDTESDRPAEHCIHQLFEQQVKRSPNQIAVRFEDQKLTYTELNARANQLGRYLQTLDVGVESPVALCLEPSLEMLVGLLGILKAGGAYVPLNPDVPKERLTQMLTESRAQVIVTRESLAANFLNQQAPTVCVDTDWGVVARNSEENIVSAVTPTNLVYVLFTSGSTGTPKGVAVEHRQLANYVNGVSERIDFAAGASFAVVSTLAADLGNTMIFPSLCGGGCLHVISRERTLDSKALADYFTEHPVDYLKIVPSHLKALLASSQSSLILPRKGLVLGGEATNAGWTEQLQALAPHCTIFNHYGPTEATVGVLTYKFDTQKAQPLAATLPLGRPMPNTQIYLLDSNHLPVAIGVTGELYIGGDGLARGYLNRPGLTAERFIPNPFSTSPGTRLYRTGDLARYLPDGLVEFLGRLDSQIKIRGFRVELGEIEAVLAAHEMVRAAVVLATDTAAGKQLAAYAVTADGALTDAAELKSYLRERLPDYMVPSFVVLLEAMPLTPNGKVDRRSLPAPEMDAEREYVAPRTPIEELLTRIWKEVLVLDQVSVTDNFFELGGHSLIVTQLISRVREAFSVELPLRTMFEASTISEMAHLIEEEKLLTADDQELAEILNDLEELSEAQAASRLAVGEVQDEGVCHG